MDAIAQLLPEVKRVILEAKVVPPPEAGSTPGDTGRMIGKVVDTYVEVGPRVNRGLEINHFFYRSIGCH